MQDNCSNNTKYALLLEYDGTNFAGSQFQPDARTVQNELEKALETVLRNPTKVVFSGRTDAGVHALGQVAHFYNDKISDTDKFLFSLNGVLPKDVAVRAVEEVDNSFHSQKSATKRFYRYSIYNNNVRTALNNKCLHIYGDLDENLMNQALQKLLGKNCFESFKSSKTDNPNTDCEIYKANCFRDGDYIYIDIVANRFVYNMIRIIVGTILEVGNKQQSTNYLLDILNEQDRTKAGVTAKADGLMLMSVEYPYEYDLFSEDKNIKVRDIMFNEYMEAQNENLLCKAS